MRIVSAAALVATLSMPALAADLDYPPLRGTQIGADPVAHWSGAYLGGFAGVARSNFSFGAMTRDLVANDYRRTLIENEQSISRLANLPDADAQSAVFGAFAGYNVQLDEVVLGIEADFTRGRFSGTSQDEISRGFTLSNGYRHSFSLDAAARAELKEYATLRARAGYSMGAFMPFVTAGLAIGRADVSTGVEIQDGYYHVASREAWLNAYNLAVAGEGPFPLPFTDHRGYRSFNVFTGTGDRTVQRLEKARNGVVNVGLAVGLGVDVAVTSNLFLRGEWQYVHFRDFAGTQASINNLRAAAGLKF